VSKERIEELENLQIILGKYKDAIKNGGTDAMTCTWAKAIIDAGYTLRSKPSGLLDKNSKEICEGDIFRHEGHELVVKFEFGAFVGSWHGLIEYVFFNDMPDDETEVEVTGNIYENPELFSLQGKSDRGGT